MSHIIVSQWIKVLTGIVIWPSTLGLWPTSQSCDLSLPVHTTWPATIWIATFGVQPGFTPTVATNARLPLTVYEVVFLSGCISVWSSSCEVIFMWYHLPVRSASCEVIFLWGHLLVWSFSCEVVFLWDRMYGKLSWINCSLKNVPNFCKSWFLCFSKYYWLLGRMLCPDSQHHLGLMPCTMVHVPGPELHCCHPHLSLINFQFIMEYSHMFLVIFTLFPHSSHLTIAIFWCFT